MIQNLCQCKGCERPAINLGMCNKHWRRNRRYGSPFVTKQQTMRGMPADVRFNRLHKKGDGCWEWLGALDADGYGLFNGEWNGVRYHRAHRFSWAFHSLSVIGKEQMVCHSCDNRKCVNPAHLWLGDASKNHADMVAKNRHNKLYGEMSPRAKLNEEQVRLILADPRPYGQIATAYNVATSTITSIKNRVSWGHLEVDHVPKNARGSGTGRRGKSARITPDIVREIRSSDARGVDLASKFAVSVQLICAIRKRRAWAHVE